MLPDRRDQRRRDESDSWSGFFMLVGGAFLGLAFVLLLLLLILKRIGL